jgi:hypothetical protein
MLHATPQAFEEEVVQRASAAIHADGDRGIQAAPPVKASLVNGDPVGINDLGLAMGAQGILSRSPSKTPPTRAKIPRKTSRRRQRQGFSRIKKARRVPG